MGKWSPEAGLNRRPRSYQERALPLSYLGLAGVKPEIRLPGIRLLEKSLPGAPGQSVNYGRRVNYRRVGCCRWVAVGLPELWWRGQDSNLRSPSGRQIYSLVALTTHPPLHSGKRRNLPEMSRRPGRAYPEQAPNRQASPGGGTPPNQRGAAAAGRLSCIGAPEGIRTPTCRLQIDCATIAPQGRRNPVAGYLGVARLPL